MNTGTQEYTGHKSTPYSWQGINYQSGLETKEIAKLIRKELKKLYPQNKYSITTQYNHISVSLTQSNINPFEIESNINWEVVSHKYQMDYNISIEEVKSDYYQTYIDNGYMQVNNYHIDTDWRLSKEAKEMFTNINDMLKSFNFDDSDIQTDYFHSNFYTDLSIGRWDKRLILK